MNPVGKPMNDGTPAGGLFPPAAQRPPQDAALASLALGLCYIGFPLSSMLTIAVGVDLWRNWIDLSWAALALVALVQGPTRHAAWSARLRLLPLFACAAGMVVWIASGVLRGGAPAITAAMEIKPVFYLLVALLLLRAGGSPSPEAYCRMGGWLSALVVAELLVRSAMAGGLERPTGSGEVNYDAALLVLSLVFALGQRGLARRYAPLIFLGLLATFSRTGLLAACIVLVFAGTVPLTLRALMVGAAMGAAVLSFVIRDLEIGALESMDRYWMWLVGLEHLSAHFWSFTLVPAPGSGIETDVPPYLLQLWTDQQEKLDIDGIFPFHFHAMWLRLTMAWGWLPVALLLLAALNALVFRGRRPPQARAMAGACLVLGLTMGLVYLGNVGVPVLLAAIQLFSSQARARRPAARAPAPVRGAQPQPV